MTKKISLTFSIFYFLFSISIKADEGMWIPLLLKQLNESDMQRNGLKLSAEEIYSINKSSLKDAIVHFNGSCTAEIISDKGLELLKSLDYIDEISKQSLKSLTTAEINTLNELLDKLRD